MVAGADRRDQRVVAGLPTSLGADHGVDGDPEPGLGAFRRGVDRGALWGADHQHVDICWRRPPDALIPGGP